MSKKTISLLAGAAIFIGATGWALFSFSYNQEKIRPKRGDVVESIYGLGTVSADQSFNIRVGIAIMVNKLFVREGEIVKKGQPLIQIDGNTFRSPISGTVTKVAYKEGELVAPQVSIMTITNLDHLYLEVSLEQQSILRIKQDQQVVVSFETLRSEKHAGKVKTVYPRDNQFIVRIELKQWPEGVLPGMTADAAIIVGKKSDVLLIPINSISSGKITRARNGIKEKISVRLGVIDNEWAEVISDNISETDELLIRKK